MISFTVYGVPVGKGRPRFTKSGHTYTPDKTAAYEQLVQLCWRTQCRKGFARGVPIRAEIDAWFPVPASVSKKKKAAMEGTYHTVRPDADNIAKAILDALNGLAYEDDSAVCVIDVQKRRTNGAPRVDVRLTEVTG